MKRVILHWRSGLYQIIGLLELDLAQHIPITHTFEGMTVDGRSVEFGLVRVTPRTVTYAEICSPPSGRFNDFHPQQI